MSETNFPAGLFYNEPSEKAPDFVLSSMSIRPDVFIEWLKEQKTNEQGYVRLQALRSKKTGKPYVTLDTYQKTSENGSQSVTEGAEYSDEEINPNDIPFN
jgi:hypothetical protein